MTTTAFPVAADSTGADHGRPWHISGLLDLFRKRVRVQRAETELQGLDDRAPRDIGIYRGEIPALVQGGRVLT